MELVRRKSMVYNISPALQAGVPRELIEEHISQIEQEVADGGIGPELGFLGKDADMTMRLSKARHSRELIQDELVIRFREPDLGGEEVVIPRRGSLSRNVPTSRAQSGILKEYAGHGPYSKLVGLFGKMRVDFPKENLMTMMSDAVQKISDLKLKKSQASQAESSAGLSPKRG